jgi:hypothetical protein
MQLAEIWRYPVKSMAGERLSSAHLTENGIDGDRVIQVYDARGRLATARTFPDLLGFHATTGVDDLVYVNGLPWSDPKILAGVRAIVGPGAKLAESQSPERFDILPLLVATDGAIEAFGRDGRRLRPNLIVGGVPGLEERTWEGGKRTIGEVVIGMRDLRGRCNMTTFDPDTLAWDPGVLRDIVKRFQGTLALNSEVLRGGTVEVGQKVEVALLK